MREVTMTFEPKGDPSVGIMPRTVAVVKAEFENVDEMLYAVGKFKEVTRDIADDGGITVYIENGFPLPSIYDEIKDLYEV